jgi:hypothetical protein
MKDEALKLALHKAFNLGSIYWQQVDSEFSSNWKKGDVTKAQFDQLVEDTIKQALAAPVQEPVAFEIGGCYNWKGQQERLIYIGYNFSGNGHWHQFAKVEAPEKVWCEVLPKDLSSFEATPPAAPVQEPVAEVKAKMTGGNVGIATVINEIYSPHREPLQPGDKLYAGHRWLGWDIEQVWSERIFGIDMRFENLQDAIKFRDKLDEATPPAAQRQWVGLDFSEVDELAREMIKCDKSVNWLAFSIDAKLKEKNSG